MGFKIKWLNSTADADLSTFVSEELCNFENCLDRQGLLAHEKQNLSPFSYTYEEKITLSQNSQKTLSFKMNRKNLIQDRWIDNPFVKSIHVGSTIELQDKYENVYLFIVTKIAYSFTEENIVYNYTCQDAFSYQYSRQQNGYTIKNDSSSDDYIGAKSIDWWTMKKIVPECRIKYSYVPLTSGLAIKDDKYIVFTSENEDIVKSTLKTENGDKIIKEPLTDTEYQETLIFSCSGSNAAAALISLSELLDLMIHTYEQEQNNKFVYYFWYEPKQNSTVSGLQYSPKNSISNFQLDFSGSNLTTVLNVESSTVGDDIITLLPSVPFIFNDLFMSKEWEESYYTKNFFSKYIYGEEHQCLNGVSSTVEISTDTDYDSDNKIIKFPLKNVGTNDFQLSAIYNKFKSSVSEHYCSFSYQQEGSTKTFQSNHNSLMLIIEYYTINNEIKTEGEETQKQIKILHENEQIPTFLLGQKVNAFLGFSSSSSIDNVTDSEFYFTFYRDFTAEEKEFATIADECPWLENKLIDFTYFLKQNIISVSEYQNLWNTLTNDLRIVNGKLLYLTDSYYKAVKAKTKIISDLTNNLDALSATFNADFVDRIKQEKEVKDISNFSMSYNTVFTPIGEKLSVLNYNELVGDYFEKYCSAEQRFLKNIYNFKKYFNELYTANSKNLCKITLTSEVDITKNSNFISFSLPKFDTWNGEDTIYPLFYYNNKKYENPSFVTEENKASYFKPNPNIIALDQDTYSYNEQLTYLITLEDYEKKFGTLQEARKTKTQDNIVYVVLTNDEIKRLIIKNHNSEYYCIDENDTYSRWTQLAGTSWVKDVTSAISWINLPNILSYIDLKSVYNTSRNIKTNSWVDDDGNNSYGFQDYLIAFLPISNLYYKGPVIEYSTETKEEKTTYYLKSINNSGDVDNTTTYVSYQPFTYIGNGLLLKNMTQWTNKAGEEALQKIQNNWTFASLQYNPNSASIYGIGSMFGIAGLLGSFTALYLGRYATDDRWTEWKVGHDAARCFQTVPTQKDNYNHLPIDNQDSEYYSLKNTYKSLYEFNNIAVYAINTSAPNEYETKTAVLYNIKDFDTTEEHISSYITENQKEQYEGHVDTSELKIDQIQTPLQYFNYYSNIAATWYFGENWTSSGSLNDIYFKDFYIRPLRKDSVIDKNGEYIQIFIRENSNGKIDTTSEKRLFSSSYELNSDITYIDTEKIFKKSFSGIYYYPVYSQSQEIDTSLISWPKISPQVLTTEEVVDQLFTDNKPTITWDDDVVCNFTGTTRDNKTISGRYIFARVERYKRLFFTTIGSWSSTSYNTDVYKWTSDQASNQTLGCSFLTDVFDKNISVSKVYKVKDDTICDLLSIPNILEGLSLYLDRNLIGLPATAEDDLSATLFYKDQSLTERAYSKEQIATTLKTSTNTDYCTLTEAQKYKIFNSSSYTEEVVDDKKEFNLTLFLCRYENGIITSTALKQPYMLSFKDADTINGSIKDYNSSTDIEQCIEYNYTITRKKDIIETISNITNGTFWYKFHTRTNVATLFENAAAIETKLQEYWDQAYTASKYCRYFLPESWQPGDSAATNGFAPNIISTITSNNQLVEVTLKDTYLPNVEIYTNDSDITFSYKNYLPKYDWYYKPDDNTSIINTTSSTGEEYILAKDCEFLNTNPGILSICGHLGVSLDNWSVVKNGYTVYYFSTGGGTEWKDLVRNTMGYGGYELFDGLYGMMFYLIKNNYTNRTLTSYENVKKQKTNIWNEIYQLYPFLLLENSYSYASATNSETLLKMAKLNFKAQKEPEKNYSLSFIDYCDLIGYKGQELSVGTGILLKAQDYYDENDDILKALNQYLFITDLNYTLRDEDNINITVNHIKYNEKLIQSLAKLIR